LGDVNQDGRVDIATACLGTGAAGVLLAQANGFAPVQPYSTGVGTTPSGIALGDTNGDGWLDIVAANNGSIVSRHVRVLRGQAGGFGTAALYPTANSMVAPLVVKTGDVNADGLADIISIDANDNVVSILTGQATGFSPVVAVPVGSGNTPQDVTTGDVNGDGRLDVVTANWNRTVSVMLAQAGGGFAAPSTSLSVNLSVPSSVALGDVNRDGRPDIVVGGTSSYASVLVAQASGFPATSSNYYTGGSSSRYIALGDLNGDGWLDLVAYDGNMVSVLPGLAQYPGAFGSAVTYATGASSQPGGVAVGDVNGDNRPDIVVANSSTHTIGVLLNTGTYTPLAATAPIAADIRLAPNPARGYFSVLLPATVSPRSAELLNTKGQVVRRTTVGGPSFQVETNGLAPGLYILRLQTTSGVLTRRVAVE
jgi:hypothetical protein